MKMFPTLMKPCTILYIVFVWLLGICYGFVLLSSASSGPINIFNPDESALYRLHVSVLLNDDASSKNVGFYVDGDVHVDTIWSHVERNERLLKIHFKSPRLSIKSRKAPAPDGFNEHSSKLDQFDARPFLVVWRDGHVDQILLNKNEPISSVNLMKGIASLFQFQLLDVIVNETDTSGHCQTTYTSLSPTKFRKTKSNCRSDDLPYIRNYNTILDTTINSSRIANYELNSENTAVISVHVKENHQMYLNARQQIGNNVRTEQILTFVEFDRSNKVSTDSNRNRMDLDQVVNEYLINNNDYTIDSLITEQNHLLMGQERDTFSSVINDLRDSLKSKLLGTVQSAKAFIELIRVARKATKDDLVKGLNAKKNQNILPQILDVLGYVQNQNSHEAVMKKLRLDNEDDLNLNERYLWALSMASHPNPDIISDLVNKFRKFTGNIPEKLKETLLLTITAMTYRLGQLPIHNIPNINLIQKVEEMILTGLDTAETDERFMFLRALKNLKSINTVAALLQVLKQGTAKEGVLAMKALRTIKATELSLEDVLRGATKAFFQIDKKYDTSSRTLAADILLDSYTDQSLKELIYYLQSNDSCFEVKQYVYQRIQMLIVDNVTFKDKVHRIIRNDPLLNNYSVLSPRGLSTALRRQFLASSSSNGSLLTVQEINGGIVKRGIVDIVLEKNGERNELFTLGIFSGGLSSFISSGDNDDADDETIATAGLELTVLGTQLRPFVFFAGQGELMGHVWSGTGSEKTTAYQALSMLQDHWEFLRLGSGLIAELELKGALSFDLSGKIEISLWNRNAESLVEKSAGVVAVGLIKVDTSFVRSQIEFSASIEPKLTLQTDVDFSANMNLCMRLVQPDSIFRYNVFKIERIPGSKHKLRIAKYRKTMIPGRTYSLNRKNDEMCSATVTNNN